MFLLLIDLIEVKKGWRLISGVATIISFPVWLLSLIIIGLHPTMMFRDSSFSFSPSGIPTSNEADGLTFVLELENGHQELIAEDVL